MTDEMRCFGTFPNDRTCDLCHSMDAMTWAQCRQEKEDRAHLEKELERIKEVCEHRIELFYEGVGVIHVCARDVLGPDANRCKPSFECKKFIEDRK